MRTQTDWFIDASEVNHYQGIGIYAIININNGKMYIGSSKNVYKRIAEHNYMFKKKRCNQRLIEDIEKGDKFKAVILHKVEGGCIGNELRKKEKEFILKNNAFQNGYNLAYTTERNHEKEKVF